MPERLQRFLLWFIALGLTVGTGVALRFAGGYRRMAGFENPVTLPPNVTLRLNDVSAVGRKNNQKAWSLTAKQVDSSKDRSRVDFVGDINVVLYSEHKPRATVKANTATYLAPNQTLIVGGGVVGVLKDPQSGTDDLKLETNQVQWSIGGRQVNAPNAVTLTLKDGRITGTNMTVDLTTRDYSMDNFEADLALDTAAPPTDPLGGLMTKP
jgi:LPS export ABC transporter protein LptC